MNGLFRKLLPPSPDTSGFCSVIMRTDGIGVLDDPQGCAMNYLNSEETDDALPPRVFASEMTEMDVVFGTESRLFARLEDRARSLSPTFAAFGGGPVSALIGTDLKAAAKEYAADHAMPCCSVNLNGSDDYDTGVSNTLLALGELFLPETPENSPNGVNLLGVNALDLGGAAVRQLSSLASVGSDPVLSAWGGLCSSQQMRLSAGAAKNLVVTGSGLALAREMEKKFSIPYEVIRPRLPVPEEEMPRRSGKVIIIGEQILSGYIRALLRQCFGFERVDVASLFAMDAQYREEDDISWKSEQQIEQALHAGGYDLCIGDPLFARLAPEDLPMVFLPHPAVSGKMYLKSMPPTEGKDFVQWLRQVLPPAEGQ